MGSETGDIHQISIDRAILPALLSSIAVQASELRFSLGEGPIQPLPVRQISTAMAADGGVAMMLGSDDDMKFVLKFSLDQVPALTAMLADLKDLLSRSVQ